MKYFRCGGFVSFVRFLTGLRRMGAVLLVFLLSFSPVFALTASSSVSAQGSIDHLLAKAEDALKKRNFGNAQGYLARARELDPKNVRLKEVKARLEKEVQSTKEACLKLAAFYRSAKNIPKAVEQYQQLLAIDPEDVEAKTALEGIGQNIRQIEQFQKSGIVVESNSGRAWDKDFYSAISQIRRARDAYESGNLDMAQKFLNGILEKEKGFADALELQKQVQDSLKVRQLLEGYNASTNKGDLKDAIINLGNLITLRPNDGKLYLWRGRLALRLENFRSARQDFLSSLQHGIPFADIRLHLAECAAGMREYSQAYALGSLHPSLPGAKDDNFLWRCHWKSYPASFLFLGFSIIFLLFALYKAFQQFDHLIGRRSFHTLFSMARYLIFCWLQDPLEDPGRVTMLAKSVRLPWFHYLNALVSSYHGRFDASQDSFQAAMASPALAPRAFFFLGLIRSSLKQSLSEHDFEQMISLVLNNPPLPWRPKFLQDLEGEVLSKFCSSGQPKGEAAKLAFEAAVDLGILSTKDFPTAPEF
ncbi:MAG: hypothetical protein WA705_01125 [Candidatus Ozemobacteraceae bacterium]